jgi:mxaD protein
MNKLISKLMGCTLLLASLVTHSMASDKMLTVSESVVVNTTAEKTWKLLGDYNSLNQWHPAVKTSELSGNGLTSGDVRILTLNDGAKLYDELIEYNSMKKAYTYRLIKAPLPIYGYLGNIAVKDNGNKTSTVTWKAKFYANGVSDEEAVKLITGVFEGGLQSLKTKFTK